MRKRRANQLNKMRTDMSGSSAADSVKQQDTELKPTRKQEGTDILNAAGCGEVHISSKLATKLRARLSLSWTKQRQLRKISKSVGIKIDSEKKERNFQKDLMCANICVEQNAMYFFEKLTNTDFLKNTPVVSISDLPTFVSNLLNQYQEKEKLT